MKRLIALMMILFLAGCGVDTMSAGATAAASKAKEIEEGKKTEENMANRFNDAMTAEQKRLDQQAAQQ